MRSPLRLLLPLSCALFFAGCATSTAPVITSGNYTVGAGETVGALVVASGDVVVADGGTVRDGIAAFSGNVTVEEGATVGGGIFVASGDLDVAGKVGGDIFAASGAVTVEPTAKVDGDVATASGSLDVSDQADIAGRVTSNVSLGRAPWGTIARPRLRPRGPFGDLLWLLLRSLVPAIVAAIVVSVAPTRVERMAATLAATPWTSWGAGCLGWIAGVLIMVALAITICLIPFSLLLGLALGLASLLGWVGLGAWLGRRLAPDMSPVASAALGTFAASVLVAALSIVPCCGGLFEMVADSLALGLVLLTRAGGRDYPAFAGAYPPSSGDDALLPPG